SSQDVTVIVLQWNCDDPENDPMVYDIYFGNNNPPPLYESDHPDKSLVVDDLIAGETYWWKIVAKDDHDNSSTGPTWTFDVTGGTGIPIEPHNVFAGLLARGERNRYLLE
ncbi:MAG: hypothetical protein ISR56_09660, partial [Bacteroidales bacterium]|nr:hypothetical protein [Bacteroidales bacterium]